jgi:hypothetical protein
MKISRSPGSTSPTLPEDFSSASSALYVGVSLVLKFIKYTSATSLLQSVSELVLSPKIAYYRWKAFYDVDLPSAVDHQG